MRLIGNDIWRDVSGTPLTCSECVPTTINKQTNDAPLDKRLSTTAVKGNIVTRIRSQKCQDVGIDVCWLLKDSF